MVGIASDHFLFGMHSNLLVLLAKQVVHRFHGVESDQRHLYEKRVPVGHRAIPQAWELLRLQFLSIFGFACNKAG